MKKIILILFLFIFSSTSHAETIFVNTGFGYYTDSDGHIVDKAILPIGMHDLKDGLIYTEVSTQEDLNTIVVWTPPPTKEEQILSIKSKIDQNAKDIMNATADDNDELVESLKATRADLKLQLNNLQGE